METARFSKMGFILAAVGSAVGLGNIWKFPYVTGEYGGGAFVLVYLLTAIFVGIFVLIAEMLIGKLGRTDTVHAFEKLAVKNKGLWKLSGFVAVVALLILSYYSVIIGWIFHYITIAFTGLPTSVKESTDIFLSFLTKDVETQLFYHTIVFVLVAGIILRGVKDGIEKINKILMPLLGVILVILLAYSVTLDSFSKAFNFMFNPDFSKLSSEAVLVAIGQAFFTLSLGMGIVTTYAASLPEKTNIVKSSITISIVDTLVALTAGLIIFSLLFDQGAESTKGPGLVFISLPTIFHEFGAIGTPLAILFFVAIAFAGITSAISLLEPMVQFMINKYNMARKKAAILCAIFFYVLGIASLLSNIEDYSATFSIGGKAFLDQLDFICSTIFVPLGGIAVVLFIGFGLEKSKSENELVPLMGKTFYNIWYFTVKFIIPLALIAVLLNESGLI